jgi:hypothetical protein
MKLEEIQNLWDVDSQIDRSELGDESLRIARMHAKYFKIFSQERLMLRKMEANFKELYRDKYEWYNGTLAKEVMDRYGWQPNPLKILRTDIAMYLESDASMREAQLKVDLQQEKVNFLESIIKTLGTLGFNIKNAIEWSKFQNGI